MRIVSNIVTTINATYPIFFLFKTTAAQYIRDLSNISSDFLSNPYAEALCRLQDDLFQAINFNNTVDSLITLSPNQDVAPPPEEGIPRWKYSDQIICGAKSHDPKLQHNSSIHAYQGGLCSPK